MHWTRHVIALKAQSKVLQVFDLEAKAKLKSTTMNEDVEYWKWVSENTLGLVTDSSVYHWDINDASQAAPVKVFARHNCLSVCILGVLPATSPILTPPRAAKSSTTEPAPMASGPSPSASRRREAVSGVTCSSTPRTAASARR